MDPELVAMFVWMFIFIVTICIAGGIAQLMDWFSRHKQDFRTLIKIIREDWKK